MFLRTPFSAVFMLAAATHAVGAGVPAIDVPQLPGASLATAIDASKDGLIVGGPGPGEQATAAGLALLFEPDANNSTGWAFLETLQADDSQAGDGVGYDVGIHGDTAVMTAPFHNNARGAAYVFQRDPSTANWAQTTKLAAHDSAGADLFGISVAIAGDIIAVGSADSTRTSGAVYLFQRNPTGANTWEFSRKLHATDATANNWFGSAVALDGDTLVVGAANDQQAGPNSGAVYVFNRHLGGSNVWGRVIKLRSHDLAAEHRFGASVAIDRNLVVVGANGHPRHGAFSGAAYVFDRNAGGPGQWGQTGQLFSEDSATGDQFGASTAIQGEIVLVGAPRAKRPCDGCGTGSAYTFTRWGSETNQWRQVERFTPDPVSASVFGASVALRNARVTIGAPGTADTTGTVHSRALLGSASIPLTSNTWRFSHGDDAVPVSSTAPWLQPDFDDSAWATGEAPFHYPTNLLNPEGTEVPGIIAPIQSRSFIDGFEGLQKLGGVSDLFVSGSTVYVTASADAAVTIADLSFTGSPNLLAVLADGVNGFNSLAGATSIEVVDNIAYITSGRDNALTIVDVVSPANPLLLAELTDNSGGFSRLAGAGSVTVEAGVAYVTSFIEHALTLIDVSDPAQPQLLAELVDGQNGFNHLGGAHSVRVRNGVAYVTAALDNAVTLIDVSDPAQPRLLAELVDGQSGFNRLEGVTALDIANDVLYAVSTPGDALSLIDVSRPSAPVLLAEVVNGENGFTRLNDPFSVRIVGTTAYVTASEEGSLTMIDVAAPESPVVVGELDDEQNQQTWLRGTRGVEIVDTTAYFIGPQSVTLVHTPSIHKDLLLRQTFEITETLNAYQIGLDLEIDDGCLIWLNGIEVARIELPPGAPPPTAEPNRNITPRPVRSLLVALTSPSLRNGTNLLCIYAFDKSSFPRQFFINARAQQTLDTTPPGIAELELFAPNPPSNSVSIVVSFDEFVQNVDAGDLRINGVPATQLVELDPATFEFQFPPPNDPLLNVEWSPDHAISDLSPLLNAFVGESRTYLIGGPPVVVAVSPAPFTHVSDLTTVDVRFNVSVAGVDAGDLRLNGFPALSVQQIGVAEYRFTFRPLNEGSYLASWNANHQIVSAASPHVPFTRSTWTYVLAPPPALVGITPSPASVLQALSQIRVTFNQPVLNVDAADLLINGMPATNVMASSNNEVFDFQFAPPPLGIVQVSWSENHDITGAAPPLRPFVGPSWTYDLRDPPKIRSIVPDTAFTLLDLVIIDITFSEDVVGVDAVDLLINSQPAVALHPLSPSRYVFEIGEVMDGPVEVRWRDDHGITSAVSANLRFAGTSWMYELDSAPKQLKVVPTPNANVGQLARVHVQFDEPVTNVAPSDLLMDGIPAQALLTYVESDGRWRTGVDRNQPASIFRFEFPPASSGPVSVEWSASQQIVDADLVPTSFLGGRWVYQVDATAESEVVLNEIFAVGSDWIEIHNRATVSVDLSGWHLTDIPANLTQWQFPLLELAPDAYVVVYATGRSSPSPTRLEANFKLASDGDYLALVEPDGATIASEFVPQYPPQRSGVSYGLSGSTLLNAYFDTPTPGAPNDTGSLDAESIRQPTEVERSVRITEIMFHAEGPPAGSDLSSGDFDFIELKNIGPEPINLKALEIVGGVFFSFATMSTITNLGPGQYLLIVSNPDAFAARYGPAPQIAGTYLKALNNSGEEVILVFRSTHVIGGVVYDETWNTRGTGFSLVPIDEETTPDRWNSSSSWRSSSELHGSPGRQDFPMRSVVVNEVLSASAEPYEDVVELFNPTTHAVDIGYWYLTDNLTRPRKFQFSSGVVLAPGDFLALDEHAFNRPTDPEEISFSFDDEGEEVYLISADAEGNLTGWVHGFSFGAADPNASFGRHVISTGDEHFVTQGSLSFFAPNSGPAVGPVVISEIMYHDTDSPANNSPRVGEYIELYNVGDESVDLFADNRPTQTWRLENAVEFAFPPGRSLPASTRMLIVGFDPAAQPEALAEFQTRYGTTEDTPILGPYEGRLDNKQDTVELYRPVHNPEADPADTNAPPYVLVERVAYSSQAPWPSAANGTGHALQRSAPRAYANDPANWISGAPSPGAAPLAGLPPSVLEHPQDQVVPRGAPAAFAVTVDGAGPFRFQWQRNGSNLPNQTNSTLTINNASDANVGAYQVLILNATRSLASAPAQLSLLESSLQIVNQPADVVTDPGTPTQFSIDVIGGDPIHYQWQYRDPESSAWAVLPFGDTNTIAFVPQLADEGEYKVVAYTADNAVASREASLIVLLPVELLEKSGPRDQTGVFGGSATFSVSAQSGRPIRYQWRHNGQALPGQTNDVLTVTNLRAADAGEYSVLVESGSNSFVPPPARLTMAPVRVIGRWSQTQTPAFNFSSPSAIRVAGSIAAIAAGTKLGFFDISSLQNPVPLSELQDGWNGFNRLAGITSIEIVNQIAYVTAEDALTLIDITDPANPRKLSEIIDESAGFTRLDGANSVFVTNHIAFVTAAHDNAVSLIDVSDPLNPLPVGELVQSAMAFEQLSGPNFVHVEGDTAYITSGLTDSLTVVDISEPSHPILLAELINGRDGFVTLEQPIAVRASGNTAYVAANASTTNHSAAITRIDVTNPARPARRSIIPLETSIHGFDLSETVTAVASYDSVNLVILPGSDPLALRFTGFQNAAAVDVVDSTVYVGDSGGVTALEAPRITPSNPTVSPGSDLSFSLQFHPVGPATVQWQFNGVDLPGETNWTLAVTLQPDRFGDYTAVVTDPLGTFNLGPSRPIPLVETLATTPPVTVSGLQGDEPFVSFSVTATSPQPIIVYQWFHNGAGIPGATESTLSIPNPTTDDDGEYFVVLEDGLDVLQSEPVFFRHDSPTVLAALLDGHNGFNALQDVSSIYAAGDLAFVTATGDNSLTIIDVADPTRPTLVSELINGQPRFYGLRGPAKVHVDGTIAYVLSLADRRVTVIDVSRPHLPEPIATLNYSEIGWDERVQPQDLFVAGDFLYLLDSRQLILFDVANPASPRRHSERSLWDSNYSVHVWNDLVCIGLTNGWVQLTSFRTPGTPAAGSLLRDAYNGFDYLAGANTSFLEEDTAYIASSLDRALTIVDVSNPIEPALLAVLRDGFGGYNRLQGVSDVQVADGIAFVLSPAEDALTIIDVANPARPRLLREVPMFDALGGATTLFASGPNVYVGGANGLLLFRFSDDNDGMPRSWETAQGFDPFDASDARGDSDFDGIRNLEELYLNTDPWDASSVLRLTIQQTPEPTLEFPAAPLTDYRIEYTESVGNTPWLPLYQVPAGASATAVAVADSAASTGIDQRYYRLVATPRIDPSIPVTALPVPAPAATVTVLTRVELHFDQPISNLAANDLLINGVAATNVIQLSPQHCLFEFSPPAAGPVSFAWRAGHGVQTGAGTFAALQPAGWNTALFPTPPIIESISPPPHLVTRNLGRIEIRFRYPVTNVTAGDLLLGGQLATNFMRLDPVRFLFEFPPPDEGIVPVEWSPQQQIRTLAPTPGHLVTTNWSYAIDQTNVVINELVANNLGSINDEDGDRSDWIELYNAGAIAANLQGWRLVDSDAQWTFPEIFLEPGEYLIVFASDKNRTDPDGTLHTNFKLSGEGEYLGLQRADRRVAHEFSPTYGWLTTGSYGFVGQDPTRLGRMQTPTPGGPNGPAF